MGRASVSTMAQTSEALRELTEISTHIEAAVVLDREGAVVASTLDDDRAGRLAGAALQLLRAAEETGPASESRGELGGDPRAGGGWLCGCSDPWPAATTRTEVGP